MNTNDDLEMIWKESVVAYFKTLTLNLAGPRKNKINIQIVGLWDENQTRDIPHTKQHQ
jgi:hypothetical protein